MATINGKQERFWEGNYDFCNLNIHLFYNHGYYVVIDNKNTNRKKRKYFSAYFEYEPVDYNKVFKIRNILKYYRWKIAQGIFWRCSSRSIEPVCSLLRKHHKILHNPPYPINK